MKRQPKPFVVEIKRSSRKAPGLPTPPIWDVAALLSSAESEAHSKPSQAAASAFFRAAEIPGSAPSVPTPERRILPVLAAEIEAFEPEPPAPPAPRTRPPVEATASAIDHPVLSVLSVAEPEVEYAETEIEYIEFDTVEPWGRDKEELPVVFRAEAESILAFVPEEALSQISSRSRQARERDLPRGERWKRRLPKIMR
jgi:hypothetical protein